MNALEFKQRFMPFHKLLYRVAYHLTGNAQDAEDLLQDTYLKLWLKRDSISLPIEEESEGVAAYLITMMRNLLRDQQRLKHLEVESLDDNPDADKCLSDYHTSQDYEAKDEAMHIHNLIECLPEKQRTVVEMHLEQGQSYREIERATGLSPGNIRVIIARAKQKLKTQFKELTHTWTN